MALSPGRNDGHRLITIQGVIGSGKTTTAQLLARRLGAELVLDHHEMNPYLAQYYANPEHFRVENDLFFEGLFYHLLNNLDPERDAVADFSLAESEAFLRVRYQGDDLAAMLDIRDYLAAKVPTPDLAIYLDVGIDVLLQRIEARAQTERPAEQKFPRQLLEALEASYRVILDRLGQKVVVLKVGARDTPQQVAARAAKAVRTIARPAQSLDAI